MKNIVLLTKKSGRMVLKITDSDANMDTEYLVKYFPKNAATKAIEQAKKLAEVTGFKLKFKKMVLVEQEDDLVEDGVKYE